MKCYVNEEKKECIVKLDKMKKIDDWGNKVIDLAELKKVIQGLSLLGKKVCTIRLVSNVYFDIDTKYYHRLEEEFAERLYKIVRNCPERCTLEYKNNRLYIVFEGQEIICPIDMINLNDELLTLCLSWEE